LANRQEEPVKSIASAHLRAAALATIVVIVAAACSSKGPSTGGGGSADAGPVQKGGALTVAIADDLREPSQLQAHDSLSRLVMGSTVYDPLFTTDENHKSAPALATGATPSADFMTWTFNIREGVKFQDGSVFDANDVKQNLDAIVDPTYASATAGDIENVASWRVVNPTQIELTLHKPDADLPATFTDMIFMGNMEKYDPEHPIGTGPYEWSKRVPGDHIEFTKFAGYWRGEPPLDSVNFKVVSDPQAAALQLQSGDVDVLTNDSVASTMLPALKANPDITVYETPGATDFHGYTNFEKDRRGGYTDGQKVRQGLADLWNPEEAIPHIIGDFGKLSTQPIPDWMPGGDPSLKPWPFKEDEGKRLLAEGGIPAGGVIKILATDRPYMCQVGAAYQSKLHDLGYDAQFQCLQPEVAVKSVQNYDWDVLLWRNSADTTAIRHYQGTWSIGLAGDPPAPPDDVSTLRDPELQGILDKMSASPADSPAYADLGKQAAQILVTKQIATLPGYFDTARIAARNNVHGIVVSPEVYFGFLYNAMGTVWKSKSQ
jgi:peptide/nickel transport system substrate-binding protein